jgi:AsmA protein
MRIVRGLLVGLIALVAVAVGGIALAAYLVDIEGLIERYRPVALEAASNALNREVKVGSVSPEWFPTLGLRLEDLVIGDAPLRPVEGRPPSGDAPFARVGAVEVGVAVWPALVSLGRDIQVTEVRVEGPELRVVRYPDGSFNFSDIGTATTSAPEPPPEPSGQPGFADRLTSASVEAVLITDGGVRYEDRTPGGIGTLDVRRVGLTTGQVGLGLDIDAELTAALKGAEEPNLRVEVATGPLAEAVAELGAPEVEKVVLHARSVPLSIVPVDVPSVELGDAALTADVSLAPGEAGRLTLSGPLGVSGLKLRQPGGPDGAAFDVELGLAVQTSTAFDRLRLQGTRVAVGPLEARASGRARLSPAVRWEDVALETTAPFSVRKLAALLPGPRRPIPGGRLRLGAKSSGDARRLTASVSARWSGLELAQAGLTTRGDVELSAEARGAPAAPRVDVRLDATPLGVEGEGYAKPAGLPARLAVALDVRPSQLRVEDLALTLADAKLSGGGVYPLGPKGQVDFGLALDALELKPFLEKLEIPAESLPEASTLALELGYQASSASPAAGALSVPKIDVSAGRSQVSASASVESFSPLVARVDGRSPYLDLDALLPGPADMAADEAEPTPSDGPLLPPSMKAARATVDLEVAELIYQGVEMSDADVLLELKDGSLLVRKTRVGLFGGRFSADGTRLDLAASPLGYELSAQLAGLRGAAMLDRLFHTGEALTGELDSQLSLSGRGLSLARAAESLSGAWGLSLRNGRFDGVDLVGATVLPLREALEFASLTADLGIGEKLETDFRALAARFEVKDGELRAKGPIEVRTPQGDITLEGAVALDGELRLAGEMGLAPALVRKLTGGKVRPRSAIPVGFDLGCTLTEPCVQNVNVDPAVATLTKLYAGEAVGKAARALEKKTGIDASKAEDAVKDAAAAKKKAAAEAEAAAREAKAKAEAEAKKKAEEAARKAKEEAEEKLKGLFGR